MGQVFDILAMLAFPLQLSRPHEERLYSLLSLAAFSMFTVPAVAEDKDPRPAAAIQDNSFLIEEAYNQEAGVVQHIQTLRRIRRDWFYTFTQEWPLGSQAHRFSYTVPYS